MVIKPIGAVYRAFGVPTTARPTTDFFTSNPTLLHHLPRNPKLAIVPAQGPASGVENATASGSGRQGWGAGSGGGYTGHARAFMALQHSAALDPSVALSYNAEEKRRRRNSLIAEHRLSRKTEVVDVEAESVGRTVHRQIEARAGKKVNIVELEGSSPPTRALEDGGRPSIPYPSSRGEITSPTPSRPSTPYIGSLPRSQSSVEVWRVGISRPRRESMRAMSTRSSSIALPEVTEDASTINRDTPVSTRVLGQPNRVLMDLAGVDLPGRPALSNRRGLVRRNSSAAIQQSIPDLGAPETFPEDEGLEGDVESANDAYDAAFKKHLTSAVDNSDHDANRILGLVQLYRTPRDDTTQLQLQSVEQKVDAPVSYSTIMYNLCLRGLLRIRHSGQSIQPFLEIYNEMLDNDCLPSSETYEKIIRALCEREKDAWGAMVAHEETKKWQRFRAESLNKGYDLSVEAERDAVQQGYVQEGNFASALRMFQAARLLKKDPHCAFSLRAIFDAASVRDNTREDVAAIRDMYDYAKERNVPGWRALAPLMAEVMAKMGDKEALAEHWAEFLKEWNENGAAKDQQGWFCDPFGRRPGSDRETLRRIQRYAWCRFAKAFVVAGDHETGYNIWNRLLVRQRDRKEREIQGPYDGIASPKTSPETNLNIGLELLRHNGDKGMQFIQVAFRDKERITPEVAQKIIRTLIDTDRLDLLELPQILGDPEFIGRARLRQNNFAELAGYLLLKVRENNRQASRVCGILRNVGAVADVVLDMDIVRPHGAAILAAGKSHCNNISHVFRPYLENAHVVRDRGNAEELIDWVYNVVRDDRVDIIGALRLLRVLQRFVELPDDETVSIALARKYLDKRWLPGTGALNKSAQAKDDTHEATTKDKDVEGTGSAVEGEDSDRASAEAWNGIEWAKPRGKYSTFSNALRTNHDSMALSDLDIFMRFLTSYPANEPELDDVLVHLCENLSGLDVAESGRLFTRSWAHKPIVYPFAQKLAYRLGEERAAELLMPVLGGDVVPEWTTLPRDAASNIVPMTPELTDGETAASDSGPSEVSGSMDASGQENTELPRWRISSGLGDNVDRHTHAYKTGSRITPQQAYDMLYTAVTERNEVPPTLIIGRLVESLSRVEGKEPEVRWCYDLAQRIISDYLATSQREHAWMVFENSMIIAACHLGHLEEAGARRAAMLQAGQAPSADAYANMITSAKDTTDDAFVARTMFDEAISVGVKPNLFLYNTMISKLGKARKADEALEMFKAMQIQHIRPSSVTYGAVINACTRVGDGESAETLFAEMLQRRINPSVPPYNTMMQFYIGTQPDRNRALYFHDLMRENRVKPTAHTYKLLLDVYGALAPVDINAVKRVFDELVSQDRKTVQGTHWASLISAYGIGVGDVDAALKALKEAGTHPRAKIDLKSEPVVWEAILNVLGQRGTLEQMEALRDEMTQIGARTTAYVLNTLISAYAKAGQMERAREVFESMEDSITGHAAPNNHPILLTSSGHVKPSTTAPERQGVVYREPSTYEAMVRAEVEHGRMDRAKELVQRVEGRRYPVAVYMRVRSSYDDALIRQQGQPKQVPGGAETHPDDPLANTPGAPPLQDPQSVPVSGKPASVWRAASFEGPAKYDPKVQGSLNILTKVGPEGPGAVPMTGMSLRERRISVSERIEKEGIFFGMDRGEGKEKKE